MTDEQMPDLGRILREIDLTGARCTDARDALGVPFEFVEVDRDQAADLVRTYCLSCPVALECLSYGRDLAPHKSASVYGGVIWPAGSGTPERVLRRTA
jgi:hypothetical protein